MNLAPGRIEDARPGEDHTKGGGAPDRAATRLVRNLAAKLLKAGDSLVNPVPVRKALGINAGR
jgi:hypothetical protein